MAIVFPCGKKRQKYRGTNKGRAEKGKTMKTVDETDERNWLID